MSSAVPSCLACVLELRMTVQNNGTTPTFLRFVPVLPLHHCTFAHKKKLTNRHKSIKKRTMVYPRAPATSRHRTPASSTSTPAAKDTEIVSSWTTPVIKPSSKSLSSPSTPRRSSIGSMKNTPSCSPSALSTTSTATTATLSTSSAFSFSPSSSSSWYSPFLDTPSASPSASPSSLASSGNYYGNNNNYVNTSSHQYAYTSPSLIPPPSTRKSVPLIPNSRSADETTVPAVSHKPRYASYSYASSSPPASASASARPFFSPTPSRTGPGTGTPPGLGSSGNLRVIPSARSTSPSSSRTADPKYKTELCQNYALHGQCEFGPSCNFAHGPSELRKLQVSALKAAGVANADTYRVRPCFTFVSTGCCPFGVRCNFLHDPRVELSVSDNTHDDVHDVHEDLHEDDAKLNTSSTTPAAEETWLGHFEQPVRGVNSDLIVANLHHHFTNPVHHGSSFGRMLSSAIESVATGDDKYAKKDFATLKKNYGEMQRLFEEFYDSIATGKDLGSLSCSSSANCKKEYNANANANVKKKTKPPLSFAAASAAAAAAVAAADTRSSSSTRRPSLATSDAGNKLSERQRLEIVLEMVYSPKASWYQYEPSHTVLGRTSMIVQTRTFALNADGSVQGIASAKQANERPTVTVYEIAYNSDGNPKARASAALYFDIPRECILPYTTRKLFSRSPSPTAARSRPSTPLMSMDMYLSSAVNQPFFLTRPYDEDAMTLTLGILKHRLQVVQMAELAELPNRKVEKHSVAKRSLTNERKEENLSMVMKFGLKARFQDLLEHGGAIYWGRCADRTDPSDMNASVLHVNGKYNPQDHHPDGSGAARSVEIWKSFVGEMSRDNVSVKPNQSSAFTGCGRSTYKASHGPKAKVFASMANETFISSSSPTPSLTRKVTMSHKDEPVTSVAASKARCWRDLLLPNDGEGEWQMVRREMKMKDQARASRPSSRSSSTSATQVNSVRYGGTFSPINMDSTYYDAYSPCATPVNLAAVPEIMF